MQNELAAESHVLHIQVLGCNGIDREAGNASICVGRDIPWLQDLTTADVWNTWSVGYRDVIILDAQNEVIDVFNLTTHDLTNASEYDALKALLTAAADAHLADDGP